MKINSSAISLAIWMMVPFGGASFGQQDAEPAQSRCSIDLRLPGTMSDIVSNALLLEFHKNEYQVFHFLEKAKKTYATGAELATAAARHFDVEQVKMMELVQKYKHINCGHPGGGEFVNASDGATKPIEQNKSVSEFSENVLTHVVMHELGHAVVREFDLPILGNEETLADAFATHCVVNEFPERAFEILHARITSLMFEAGEVARNEWTVKGEHNSDARRAYQIAALAIAHDADRYGPLAELVEMSHSQARQATDYGSEIHRSWRRILAPLKMPTGQKSTEARLRIDDDCVFGRAIQESSATRDLVSFLRSFDWHSQVTIRFAAGEGGAGWSRSRRTVTVHDGYIQRFIRQGQVDSANVNPNPEAQ